MDNKNSFQAKVQLTRLIAHEVRNPLTNINLAVDQLKNDDAFDEEFLPLLDVISRNSNRINLLINNLLASFKYFELKPAAADVHRLINEILLSLQHNIDFNEIKVVREFCKPVYVLQLDKDKFYVALKNIIINALEACENNNILIIKTEQVDDQCVISFKDNGHGINKDVLKKIFSPFFSSKVRGAGLGLASSKNIIEAHGGDITISSADSSGTTVVVRIPVVNKKGRQKY